MPLGVNTNLAANGILANLSNSQSMFNTQVERLSSGLRINRGADDPAGLVISEKYRAQVEGLGQAIRNARDGINLVQTAEGSLSEIAAQLQSIRTLVLHASQDATNVAGRAADQAQIDESLKTIDYISKNTYFGSASNKLLDGSFSTKTFQIGAFEGQTKTLSISTMSAEGLALATVATDTLVYDAANDTALVDVAANTAAADYEAAISLVDAAINTVATQRANLGSFQKDALESTVRNALTAQQNIRQAESQIRDADMAQETLTFSKSQILQQTGLAMLAQANQAPQQLLSLFR